jgi:hypothetical protein
MSDLEMKSFGPFEIKSADRGEVEAVVASLDTVDHDREVILSSAIKGDAKVKISFYGHGSIFGEAPVGKGTIRAEGSKAILRANFFMSTTRGREAFETVKALGTDGEWSVGFQSKKAVDANEEWKALGATKVFEDIDLFEVSPVIRGASPNTATIGVKELEPVEPVAQADGDSAVEIVTAVAEAAIDAQVEAASVSGPGDDPNAPPPEPVETEEAKAARVEAERVALDAAVQAKAQRALELAAKEEYERVRRTWKRMGYAA